MITKRTAQRRKEFKIALLFQIPAGIIGFFMLNILVQAVSVPLAMLAYGKIGTHPPQSLIFYFDCIVVITGFFLYRHITKHTQETEDE